jgi:hypothetical protein
MLNQVKDIFKQNSSKNMINGVEWEEVSNDDSQSTADSQNTNFGGVDEFAQNFSTIANPQDVDIQDMGNNDLKEFNSVLGVESNDVIDQIGMKMFTTKEYNVVVEKDPLELGDERFDEEIDIKFD